MSRVASPPRPVPRPIGVLAGLLSLALHGLGIVWFHGITRLPEIDLTIEPSEAEFGVAEPAQAPPPTPAEAAPPPQPTAAAPTPGAEAAKPPPPPRPKPKPKAKPVAANAYPEAGTAGRFAPHGAQLALRLDLERIADSPYGPDVSSLLATIPDVRALLEGSGVDPMQDLSRLFLASPDLRREHVVLAGRYRGDDTLPRRAVEQLATQRGTAAPWRTRGGIPVAAWLSDDPTPRVVALIGPALFAITREEDVARVLAVAEGLRSEPSTASTSAADALVHMAERELMNISVDNARSFVRGGRVNEVPDRLTVSARTAATANAGLEVTLNARYPDAAQAEAARRYWDELRARYASHPLVELFGVASILRSAELTQRRQNVSAALKVSSSQARMVLRMVRDSLRKKPSAGASQLRHP